MALPVVVGVAVGEALHWRFLGPLVASQASERLGRAVSLADATGRSSLRLRLLGGIHLQVGHLQVANAEWSRQGPMVELRAADLHLHWRDLFAALRQHSLRIDRIAFDAVQLRLERRADGRASWQFPQLHGAEPAASGKGLASLRIGAAHIGDGTLEFDDQAHELALQARFDASTELSGAGRRWTARADGRYRGDPVRLELRARAADETAWTRGDAPPLPFVLDGRIGKARLGFEGVIDSSAGLEGLRGRYHVAGDSLFAAGAPLGVTLPTTGPFELQGLITHRDGRWATVVEHATIGRSRLQAELSFGPGPKGRPTLQGALHGPELWLADLGPSIGVPAKPGVEPARKAGRVLPDRPFDLPSLRGMDADVTIALDRFESGSERLRAVQPLRAHLKLDDGRLAVGDIDARVAQGRLRGRIELQAIGDAATFRTDLTASHVRLEQWILQRRGEGEPPYVTGWLAGRMLLEGRGRSTAELLASAQGRVRADWSDGTVSHLALEAAGLDVAQALGVLLRGDDALAVSCGVADLELARGIATPKLVLIDTRDSLIQVDGRASLADEKLALVAKVAPKDASPLALRTPLHIDGTFAKPEFSLEKAPLLQRLVPAALLGALINPALALLPLIDLGDDDAAHRPAGCQSALAARTPRDPRPAEPSR